MLDQGLARQDVTGQLEGGHAQLGDLVRRGFVEDRHQKGQLQLLGVVLEVAISGHVEFHMLANLAIGRTELGEALVLGVQDFADGEIGDVALLKLHRVDPGRLASLDQGPRHLGIAVVTQTDFTDDENPPAFPDLGAVQ